MIVNLTLLILFTLSCTGLLWNFLIIIYITIFQAEKLRRLIASQPEYMPYWFVFVPKSYKPFKWWHGYRRLVFALSLQFALIGGEDSNLTYERVTSKVTPKFIKYLCSSAMWAGWISLIGIALFSVLNYFAS